jgi:hypothetical protein
MKKLSIIFVLIPLLISCEERAEIIKINITVRDATTWTIANPLGESVPGATVMLYQSNKPDHDFPDFKGVTDANGKITFNIMLMKYLVIKVEKGDLSNVVVQEIDNNLINGYIIYGVFKDMAEIDSSPYQPNASVGSIRIADMNADGQISSYDRYFGLNINISENSNFNIYVSNKNVNPLN